MQLENRVIRTQSIQAVIGQVLGFVTMLVCVGFAIWCASRGQSILAGTIVTVTLGGGFAAFITGRQKQKKELQAKKQAAETAPPP